MGYGLQDTLTIRLDGGWILNENEHDTARLERMFALLCKVAVSVGKHAEHLRFGLQTVCATEGITVNGDSLGVKF
jgi:hypothetical protein